jgi:hypothetical protein
VSTFDLFGRTKQGGLLRMGPRALVLRGFALPFALLGSQRINFTFREAG